MSRWWLLVILGWLALLALVGQWEKNSEKQSRRFTELCPCKGNMIRHFLDADPGPGSPTLPRAPPAPTALSLQVSALDVGPQAYLGNLAAEVRLRATFVPQIGRVLIVFAITPPPHRAEMGARHVAVEVEGTDLADLGRPNCGVSLPITAGDRVRATVRAVSNDGYRSEPVTVETVASAGAEDIQDCRRPRHHGMSAMGLYFLLLIWGALTFFVAVGSLVALASRRTEIDAAPIEGVPLSAALRLMTRIANQQAGLAVLFLLGGLSLMIFYPIVALGGAIIAATSVIPAARWRAARRFESMAAAPGALVERKGSRMLAAHGGQALRFDCAPKALRRAVASVVPPAQALR